MELGGGMISTRKYWDSCINPSGLGVSAEGGERQTDGLILKVE